MGNSAPQYLRPHQIASMESEAKVLENDLQNPGIQDKGAVRLTLNKLQHQLDTQKAPQLTGMDLDKAVKREAELRQEITHGMLSQEEMRKNPPGVVGELMRWEKANKQKILEWKNLRLTLHHGTDDPDVANLERFRPRTSRFNMHGAQIEGKEYWIPSEQYKANYDVAFGNEPEESGEELMAQVKDLQAQLAALREAQSPPKPERKRVSISEEERSRRSQRAKEMWAQRRAREAEEAAAQVQE
jgi:hypothetical protein